MKLQDDSNNTKQQRSVKSKHRQSSNFSSTEFIIEPQKDDDEANILSHNMHIDDHDSNAFLKHYQVKDSFNNMLSGQSVNNLQTNQANASSSAVTPIQAQILSGIVDFNGIEAGNISINEINQQRNQLFNAKEHQSLMEIPQREIQSVYSPSQPIQTPSGNELSYKQDTAKLPPGSLVHLSIDVKAIEVRQKRHSVLKQKLSEMQDLQSQEVSVKGTSNDLQSEVAKMGSQIERDDDPKYMRLMIQQQQLPQTQQLQLQQQQQQQQILSQYNPAQQQNRQIGSNNNNSSSSGKQSQNNPNINNNQHFLNGQNTNNNNNNNSSSSSNNNKASNSNMPSLVFRQSNNNMQQLMLQYNQQSQQLLHSNHQQPLTNSQSPQSLQSQQMIQQQQQFTLINKHNNQLNNQAQKDEDDEEEEETVVQQNNKNKDNHNNNNSSIKVPLIIDNNNNNPQKLLSLPPVQESDNPSRKLSQRTSSNQNRSSNKDKIIDLFISKLKDTTVLLRKQSLSPKYYAIINDLSSPVDIIFLSSKKYLSLIVRCVEFLPIFDEYSIVSGVNAFIQIVCILVLLFLISIQLVLQVPKSFQRDYLSDGLSPVFLVLMCIDVIILLNSSRDNHVYFQDNQSITQENNFTAHSHSFRRYLKMNFLFDMPVLILVILDCLEVDMNLTVRLIFFLKLIPLGLHVLSLEVFTRQKKIMIIAWFCVKVTLAIGLFTHLVALAWFRIGLNQPNNWIQEMSFENSSWEIQYAASLFWAVSMITQMSNYQPKSIQELSFSSFVMAFSWIVMVCAFLKINEVHYKYCIQQSYQSLNPGKDTFLPQPAILSEYLSKKKNTTHCVKTKALQFMESYQKSRAKQLQHQQENLVFETLSGPIKQEIKEQQNKWILSQFDVLAEHFSPQTLKDLSHFVQEQSLSPGEFVFHEQTVQDSSIYIILEGKAGLFQGDSTHNTQTKPIQNYIQILQKNDIFGQVSFFTGLERETSVIAVDFLRVGKISRKDLLSVVSKDKLDLERLAMLKDLFMVYQETNCFGVICESCGSITHTVKDCPLTHMIFDRVKIVHRHIYSVENIRNPAVKRRGPARFRGPYVVMEKAEDIQEMLLEDNVCYGKLMELIQQVNIDGGDELINTEDDEEMEYEDEANGSNSDKDFIEDDDDQQQPQVQQRMLGIDNLAKISNDYEDENLKQQMFKHARSTMNANYNTSTLTNIANNTNLLNNNNNNNNNFNQQYSTIFNNNYSNNPNQMFNNSNNNAIISNISGSGGRNNNDLSNTANNPHTTDNSSQLSKANVKSLRKNSSSSQIAVENVANKEFKNMTYNTMQTDQQFQSQEFLNDTVSNNNTIQGIGYVNNLNSLINLHNFPTNYNNTTSLSNPNSLNNNNNNQVSNSNSNSNNLNSLVNNANSAPINVNNQISSSSNPINSHSNNNNNNNPSNHGNQSSQYQSNHNNNPSSQFISNHNNPSSYIPSIPSPVPLSGETRKSIPDIAQNHLSYEQTQRISNKRLTTQTAPQIYSRTKSHASRKSQNQQKNNSGSPDNQQQSTEKNNQFQELMLDPSSVVREYNQDFTISSKKSKQKLKFADDQILTNQRSGEGVAGGSATAAFKNNNNNSNNNNNNNNNIPNSNFVNNPTNTSLQLSPYQESNSSKDNNNNSNSQLIPNYILQQFQSLLLKFQLMFRQIQQQKRDNSLQMALDKMNIEKSDMVLDLPAHSGLKTIKENRESDRKIPQQMLGSSAYRGGIDTNGLYYSKNQSYQQQQMQQQQQQFQQLPGYYYSSQLPRYLDEFTLDIMKNFTIYFPHNNFEVIYPQLLLFQRFRVSQSPVLSPKRAPPSLIMYNPSHEQSMAPMSTLPIPLKPQYGGKVSSDRKTSSTNPSITKIRKSQYSLTYGVQMNQQKKRQILGSINSATSSMNNKQKQSVGQQENSSVEMKKQLEKGQQQSQQQNQEGLEQQREQNAIKEIHLFPQT